MIKKIIGTAASRIIIAGISFLLLIINANFLGAAGLGLIGLIVLGITIVLLLNNFVGGAALVYLTARYPLRKLLIPSYLWALLTFLIFYGITYWVKIVPDAYRIHVLFLALLQSFSSIHINILAGQERFKAFNFLHLLQSVLTLLTMLCIYFVMGIIEVMSFVYSLYFAYSITFFISIISIYKSPRIIKEYTGIRLGKDLFKYGSYIQFADIFQLLNYRLNYYFVEFYVGLSSLGRYTAGVQISEGLWIIGRSISTVQYASISNSSDQLKSAQLSLSLLKISFLITFTLLLIILILPESFYIWVLGKDFKGVKEVIWFLSPGILFFSTMTILAHYFSGTGRQHNNTISSALGVLITIIVAYILVPQLGIVGAAITSSLSILISFLFLLLQMLKEPFINWKSFLFKKSDFIHFKKLIDLQIRKTQSK